MTVVTMNRRRSTGSKEGGSIVQRGLEERGDTGKEKEGVISNKEGEEAERKMKEREDERKVEKREGDT